jgi:futalosine hydrolase
VRILVVTAVAAEQFAALADLEPSAPLVGYLRPGDARPMPPARAAKVPGSRTEVVAIAGGVGPVAAAVSTSRVLSRLAGRVDLVVSAGLAGGFLGRAGKGEIVLADQAAFADLGARTDDGFLDLAGLGLDGGTPLPCPAAAPLASTLTGVEVRIGTVLTLATMTGTDERAAELAEAYPDALAEAMEGYAVAVAAREHGVGWAEVRAISNTVGRRDRSTWDIPAAFAALGTAIAALASAA